MIKDTCCGTIFTVPHDNDDGEGKEKQQDQKSCACRCHELLQIPAVGDVAHDRRGPLNGNYPDLLSRQA